MNAAEQALPGTAAADFQNWLALHDLGFSLIPLKPADKRAAIGWKAYQTKRASCSDLEAWYKASPNANIGIVTGAVSGLVVLDLDNEEAVAEAQRRGLPDTLIVRTGKGQHVYFRHPGNKITNRAGFLPGMDIRGDGGYVVGPGSLHPSGAVYTWQSPPGEAQLADMPQWLAEVLRAPAPPAQTTQLASPVRLQTRNADHQLVKPGRDEPAIFSDMEKGLPRLLIELLGQPSAKTDREWRYRGRGSLSVRVDGAKPGQWYDHEAGRGGGLVALVTSVLGCSYAQACDWIADRTGVRPSARGTSSASDPSREELTAKARYEAQRILADAKPAPANHPYLIAKGIKPLGILIDTAGRLVIGLRDIDGVIHTVQRIDAHGNKRFLAGGAKADHFAVIGEWTEDTPHLLVCEGWATGASIHEATGEPVVVAFDAGNLIRVTRVLRRRYPNIELTIVADNDAKPDRTDNPGVAAATEAARDNDARLALSDFAGDANDLVRARGFEALRAVIAAARWVGAKDPTYTEPEHDVAGARAELASRIATFMDEVAAFHEAAAQNLGESDVANAPKPPLLGLPVDVGLGKTSQVRDQIIAALAAKKLGGGKVVFAVPRHDLGEEQVDAFARAGVAAVLWKGRTAPDPVPENPDQRMCLDPDAQADALAAELSVEQAVCKVKRDSKTFYCPHYEVCGYQRQKLIAKSAQVVICAHDSLFHAMPQVIGRPALLVIDEGFWQSGLRGTDSPVQITIDSLDPYDADLRCYDHKNAYDYPETQFLIEHRLKLWKVLELHREGPLRLADLRAARLTPTICRDAAKLERGRLRDPGILPGMSAEERAKRLGAVMPRRRNAWAPPGRAAAMWSILAEALDAGHDAWGVQVGRMHTPNGTVRSLDLLWRSSIRTGWIENIPVLHIDATMRQELVTPFLPGISVAPAVSAKTPHVRIRQVLGAPVSGKALVPGPHAKDREHTTAANNLRALRTYLFARTLQIGGGTAPVLAIAQMRALAALSKSNLPANLETAHFNALSGMDRWGNVAGMVIMGRTLPAPSVIAKLQIALTGRPPQEDNESWWYPLIERVIRRPNGRSRMAMGEHHPDPIAEAIRWNICEGELIQAMGRGRGVNRTADNPLQIDLLTDIVLPITADEVIDWPNLVPSRTDMMASRGVVLDNAADRAKCFPDLWSNYEAARKDGQRTGTKCYYRIFYNSEMSRSSAAVTYRPEGSGQKVRSAMFNLELIPDPAVWLTERLGPLADCEVVTGADLAA
jgi:putative DNA primase/helicase